MNSICEILIFVQPFAPQPFTLTGCAVKRNTHINIHNIYIYIVILYTHIVEALFDRRTFKYTSAVNMSLKVRADLRSQS